MSVDWSNSGTITLTLVPNSDGTISGTANVPTEFVAEVIYQPPNSRCIGAVDSVISTGMVTGTDADLIGTFSGFWLKFPKATQKIVFTGARRSNTITGSIDINQVFVIYWTETNEEISYPSFSTTISNITLTKSNDVAITLTYGANADKSTVSAYAEGVIKDILKASGETSATISSTARDAHNQARVMYDNLVSKGVGKGVDAQKKLYGANGDKVIDVYVESKKAKKTKDEIISDMEVKINELGCYNVTHHCADPKKLVVVDIAPSSIKNKDEFIKAAKAESRVSNFLEPPDDPGYHLEIPAK